MTDTFISARKTVCRALVVLMGLALLPFLAVLPADAVEDRDAEQQFIDLINADRRGENLVELTPVSDVRQVALAWSNVMASERRMYHNPDYSEQFCCWRRAAENVGWTTVSNLDDPDSVAAAVQRLHKAFMDSPGHRANLMHPDHDHIGLAVELRPDSCPDGYGVHDCMWVTENFRQWDGTQPDGGVQNPYTDTDAGDDGPSASISDTVYPGGFDGDVTTIERLGAATDSAIQVSRARFGTDQARHAVLARDDRFPDSLAGSPLSADGPLLLTPTTGLASHVRDELVRTLRPGSTVYLLGGESALSRSVDRAVRLEGLWPVRLDGEDRVATALTIADEVRRIYGDNGKVVVARGWGHWSDPDGPSGWVDSVTGGVWATNQGAPVVLSTTAALSRDVDDWLVADAPRNTILLGRQAALSDAVLRAVPNGVRVGGVDRADTAAAVATDLWGMATDSSGRRFVVVDGWSSQGWRHGLAAAGLAADAGVPMLLARNVGQTQPSATNELVTACGTPSIDLLLVGPIFDRVGASLEHLDGTTC